MNLVEPRLCHRTGPATAHAIIASLDDPEAGRGGVLRGLPTSVSCVQVRADRVGDIPPGRLREEFGGELLYSLASSGGEGKANGVGLDRGRRLIAAAEAGYDLIELEGERDIDVEVLEAIPPERRLISWRGSAASALELASRFRRLSSIPARSYLLVMEARRAVDGMAPLLFLRSTARADVTAYADGEMGLWSRVLATRVGAPMVFVGHLGEAPGPSDGPESGRMIGDFGLTALPAVDRICGIAGMRAATSLSPRLHNAAYRALGYPGLFLPFPVDSFAQFWHELVESRALEQIGMRFQGLTVASPNKETAVAVATVRSSPARRAESANLVFRRGPAWVAATTDPTGVIANVRRWSIPGRRAAVVGCGGSGRAIALALSQKGASVMLVNRCRERGEHASRLLGLPFTPISAFSVQGYDLVINATPVGSQGDVLPFAINHLARDAVVVDLVYVAGMTALVAAAQARGVKVVEGRQVLLTQVERQFFRMTGLAPPVGVMAEMLGLTPMPSAQ